MASEETLTQAVHPPEAVGSPQEFEAVHSPDATRTSSTSALFDALRHDVAEEPLEEAPSGAQRLLSGLLWLVYALSVVVVLMMIWSSARSLSGMFAR